MHVIQWHSIIMERAGTFADISRAISSAIPVPAWNKKMYWKLVKLKSSFLVNPDVEKCLNKATSVIKFKEACFID